MFMSSNTCGSAIASSACANTQGSDLLASHLLLVNPHKIYMPDVFQGAPFPPEKDGDKDTQTKFFGGM